MQYNPTETVLAVHQNPPGCLLAFRLAPLLAPARTESVFDELALFQVACKCGNGRLQILGYPHPDAGLLCPHHLACPTCNARELLFDARIHGYDAELQHGCYSMIGSGDLTVHACRCGGEVFEPVVGVSYQFDPDEDLDPDQLTRLQDFFDGYWLEATCAACHRQQSLSSYECA